MTYTIEETDLEREHLLAEFLYPVTIKELENISLQKHPKILDVGCGHGDGNAGAVTGLLSVTTSGGYFI